MLDRLLRFAPLLLCCCPDADLLDETTAVTRDADLEPPRVVALSLGPVDAAAPPSGVSVLPTIEVTLSEPLDAATLTPSSVTLAATDEPTAIALAVSVSGARLTIDPGAALRPLTLHELVLAGTLRDLHGAPLADARGVSGPFTYSFVTADAQSGPPAATLVSPQDGASEVPRNLDSIAVSFSEAVWGTMRCGELEATCTGEPVCRIGLFELLRAATDYSVDLADVADAEGTVARGQLGFHTGSTVDEAPPELLPTACAPEEQPLADGCLTRRDVAVTIRLTASEPATAWAAAGPLRGEDRTAAREHRIAITGLEPDTGYLLELGVRDGAGNETAVGGLSVRTLPPLAPIVVTEVYADALGPEPAQEFVEICNLGDAPVDLEGFALADAGGPGAPVPAGVVLQPGAYALIVSDRFDPRSVLDPPVGADVLLARVAGSLGTNGLLNAGEVVVLQDSEGMELSRYPNFLPPRAGVSIERTTPDADEQDPASWIRDPGGAATPGRVNEAP